MRYSPATAATFARTKEAVTSYIREQGVYRHFIDSVGLRLVGHISPRICVEVKLKDGRFRKTVLSLNPTPVTPRVLEFIRTILPQKEV